MVIWTYFLLPGILIKEDKKRANASKGVAIILAVTNTLSIEH
jgi:hypothetical protein